MQLQCGLLMQVVQRAQPERSVVMVEVILADGVRLLLSAPVQLNTC